MKAPDFKIESGAKLSMLRPVKFVQPDEDIFRANAKRFTDKTGVEMKVDFVGWEDINQQTAVTSNSGAGPDLIMGFSDAPHIYMDKLIELSDVADYLGKKYGGWAVMAERYGKKHGTNTWIGIPFGASFGPLIYRKSILQAGRLRQGAGRHGRRAGAVQEAEGRRQAGRLRARQRGRRRQRFRQLDPVVARRVAAGREGRRHHQLEGNDRGAEVPEGALSDLHSGHDLLERRLQQPRLFGGRNLADGERRVALLLDEERPGDQGDRRRHRASAAAEGQGPDRRRWAG